MSGVINIYDSSSDSESDADSRNNMSASKSDDKYDLEWLKKEHTRRRLHLQLAIMKLEDEEPRNKAVGKGLQKYQRRLRSARGSTL